MKVAIMALWKGWLVVAVAMGVLAGEIHTFLGEEDQSDNDESISAQSTIPPASSPSSYEDSPSYFDSEPLPEDNSHHPPPPSPSKEAQLEGRQVQPQGQEESGIMVLLAICAASFFSVYVIYSLFGKKKERRRGTELRTYSRSTAS